MERRDFLKGSATLALPSLNPAAAQTSRRPNLLFILADQWRAQTLPSSGDPDLEAPNLKALAAGGVHFSRVYASNPVCSPSRASVLTGRFPHACRMPHNDLLLPLEEPSIAAGLKDAGYATGYIGKWHLDGEDRPGFVPPGPRRRGFDYWAAFNRGHNYFRSTYFRDTGAPIQPTGFEPDYQTDLAIDFIRRNKATPFYLYLSWGPPHTPRTPPPKWARRYDPQQFHLRENVPESYAAKAREGLAGYYGLCSALDENLGRILRVLTQEGLAENTMVVFTSDHGDMVGSQGLEYKGVPYEESARIPLLIRYPGRLAAGETNEVLVSNVDLMPTLLSLCGAAKPGAVQGRDLSRLLLEKDGSRPESIFSYGRLGTPGEWRMIVRGLDKLVVDKDGQVTHLYNLGQDPFEMRNIAGEPAQSRRRDELQALLRDWRKRIGDGMDASGLKKRG